MMIHFFTLASIFRKHLNGKVLHESLIDKPEVIKKLVCLMNSFDDTLKEINEGVENQSAKRIKLS